MYVLKFVVAWTDVSKFVLCVQHPRSLVTGSSVCACACLYAYMYISICMYVFIGYCVRFQIYINVTCNVKLKPCFKFLILSVSIQPILYSAPSVTTCAA
jgi:hypothetical protein